MATEIERKWLVERFPDAAVDWPSELIQQGYLAIGADGSEVRLRRKSGRPVLTVKSGGGLTRTETEIDLTEAQFSELWPATEGRRVEKRRYRSEGVELDVYAGQLEGLIVAEREFASETDASAYAGPEWLGSEVTEDRRFKNQSLAVHGRPPL